MGNSQAADQPRDDALAAERNILEWGRDWWKAYRGSPAGARVLAASLPPGARAALPADAAASVGGLTFEQLDHDAGTLEGVGPVKLHAVRVRRRGEAAAPDGEADAPTRPPLVVLAGYGSGIGIYYTVLPGLAELWKGPVYCVDWLGCGLSSRPPWTGGYGAASDLEKTEDYFCDALHAWRASAGLAGQKMCLAGHSMGGYLATAYAERFPDDLHRLVLVSPVGVPQRDPSHKARMANAPMVFRLALGMWERGWSPMALPGKWYLIGKHGERRYNDASWTSKELLRLYFYGNWTASPNPSAGAYTHCTLLTPGAYARAPLRDRIPALAGRVPRVSCIYGKSDWMGSHHAVEVRDELMTAAQRRQMPVDVSVVAGAGHNMMVDNPVGFLEAFGACMAAAGDGGDGGQDGDPSRAPSLDGVLEVGHRAWMLENGTLGKIRTGGTYEAQWRAKGRGGEVQWDPVTVEQDNGDGTFAVRWGAGAGTREGKVYSRLGGHKLREVVATAAAGGHGAAAEEGASKM